MSMSDPIADMLTRIRNAQKVFKKSVAVPSSNFKAAILKVLKDQGYIEGFSILENEGKPSLDIQLKYYMGAPVINNVRRGSRPGLRDYKSCADLPRVMDGLGVAVISTSKGAMSDREARAAGLGGEVVCYVS